MSVIEELDEWLKARDTENHYAIFFNNCTIFFDRRTLVDIINISVIEYKKESLSLEFDEGLETPEAKDILIFVADELLENAKSMMEASKEIQNVIFEE
jgi:hypothetical protein